MSNIPRASQFLNFWSWVKNAPATARILIAILLCYPSLHLTINGSTGVVFFLLLIASILYLFELKKSRSVIHWDGCSIAFSISLASPVLAIFLSQAIHGNFDSQYYDWASRFLLAIPIYLALRQTDIRVITVLQIGIPLGTLITLLALLLHPYTWPLNRHTTSAAFNLIQFGDTTLLLGFLSLFCINWEHKDSTFLLALKLCGFLAGLYMSMQAGERGGWIALPFLLLVWIYANSKENTWVKFGITLMVVIAAIWISYYAIDIVQYRLNSAFDELHRYALGDKDTNVGIRLQLWLAAIHLFAENPFFGVGPGGFALAMPELNASGMLTQQAAFYGHAEVHSEILAKCAETGLIGLASILSVFLIPLYYFWHATKSSVPTMRIAGFMGVSLVLGFFMFGITVEIFDLIMTSAFFSLTLAVLMAAATNKSVN